MIKNYFFIFFFFTLLGYLGCGNNNSDNIDELVIYKNKLNSRFDISFKSSSDNVDWVKDSGDNLEISYPGGHPSGNNWGAVEISTAIVSEPPYTSENYSHFNTLMFDVKGRKGGETFQVRIRDKEVRKDDFQVAITACDITTKWKRVIIPLDSFFTEDLKKLSIPIEFLFSTAASQKISVKNIKYDTKKLNKNDSTCFKLPIFHGKKFDHIYHLLFTTPRNVEGTWVTMPNSKDKKDTIAKRYPNVSNWGDGNYFSLEYPIGLDWGEVFINIKTTPNSSVSSVDLSYYTGLSIDLMGGSGDELIDIIIEDDSSENELNINNINTVVTLSTEWTKHLFDLSKFPDEDITRIKTLAKFKFSGPDFQTLFFKNLFFIRR